MWDNALHHHHPKHKEGIVRLKLLLHPPAELLRLDITYQGTLKLFWWHLVPRCLTVGFSHHCIHLLVAWLHWWQCWSAFGQTIKLPWNYVQIFMLPRGLIQASDTLTFSFSVTNKSRFSLILRNVYYGLAEDFLPIHNRFSIQAFAK